MDILVAAGIIITVVGGLVLSLWVALAGWDPTWGLLEDDEDEGETS